MTDDYTVHDLNRLDSEIRFELEQRITELEAENDRLVVIAAAVQLNNLKPGEHLTNNCPCEKCSPASTVEIDPRFELSQATVKELQATNAKLREALEWGVKLLTDVYALKADFAYEANLWVIAAREALDTEAPDA